MRFCVSVGTAFSIFMLIGTVVAQEARYRDDGTCVVDWGDQVPTIDELKHSVGTEGPCALKTRGIQPSEPVCPPGGAVFRVQFDYNSAEIKGRRDIDILNRVGELYTDYPDCRLRIEGHADATGSYDYNQGLSERRAEAVAAYLGQIGIQSKRLKSVGKGESEPLSDRDPYAPENRRVEFLPGGEVQPSGQ